MDIEKRAHHLSERLNYIRDIFDGKHPEDIELLHNRLNEFFRRATEGIQSDPDAELTTLEELFTFMERKLETKIQPMDKVRIVRDGTVIFEGKISSLRRFKDDVKTVKQGYECGIGIDGYQDIKLGDLIEGYKVVEVERTE